MPERCGKISPPQMRQSDGTWVRVACHLERGHAGPHQGSRTHPASICEAPPRSAGPDATPRVRLI